MEVELEQFEKGHDKPSTVYERAIERIDSQCDNEPKRLVVPYLEFFMPGG